MWVYILTLMSMALVETIDLSGKALQAKDLYRIPLQPRDINGTTIQTRDPRFFPFIVFAKILPDPCTTASGDMGTCYISKDCRNLSGIADGKCAQGLGVCCKFQYECEGTIKSNVSYLVSNGFPAPYSGNCHYNIPKLNNNICQLRLDFDKFTLEQPEDDTDPTTATQCIKDQFYAEVGGATPTVNIICGDNDGQHMYLDVSSSSMSTIIMIETTLATSSVNRMWKIRVTQIACDTAMRAPDGCLQYFDSNTGYIQSFNYQSGFPIAGTIRQLANMDYAVCIRTTEGKGIKYEKAPTDEFSLSGDNTSPGWEGVLCQHDFISIPSNKLAGERYCGFDFKGGPAVTTHAKPFIVRVVTDNDEVQLSYPGTSSYDKENKGFKLSFTQVP